MKIFSYKLADFYCTISDRSFLTKHSNQNAIYAYLVILILVIARVHNSNSSNYRNALPNFIPLAIYNIMSFLSISPLFP